MGRRRINSDLNRGAAMMLDSFRVVLVLLLIAILAGASGAHAQRNLRRFALRTGESTVLREYYFVVNCRSILLSPPVLEVLEGPEELAVQIKEGQVVARAQNCAAPVLGGTVVATAKEVGEPKEAKLTFRLKFNTKAGERQSSDTYIISLFPAAAQAGESSQSTPPLTQPASRQ